MKPSNMRELVESKKFLFFGGKGGVGKTTMASATATWLADQGYKTLIVATDPTISLSAIYEQDISETEVVSIGDTGNLYGLNINPKKAMGVFQTRMNEMMEGFSTLFGSELLSTPCTEEIATFDQFVSYMGDTEHDKVVFDTAPTGHTLRELSMPFDWSSYIANQIESRKEMSEALGFIYDENMIADLRKEKDRYDAAVKALSDAETSAFNLVLLPEKLPVDETERAADDLRTFGIHVRSVIINEVIPREVLQGNWFLERRRATQDKYLALIEEKFKDLIRAEVPLFESDIYGVDNLRKVGRELYE
ncbi:MAG TPA: ArsA family ATPase [Euryarchaeota archaeon]|nr:ArsA family ATPase [Euryarchaeota archaeon]HOB37629.1 ArsA family ATPase [Methanomassiliicoccaceae archaeon]HOL07118.1 ArsA family ATPase [Methanomassiliicoccaceae archaeon]